LATDGSLAANRSSVAYSSRHAVSSLM
jgi:hypothetical protein